MSPTEPNKNATKLSEELGEKERKSWGEQGLKADDTTNDASGGPNANTNMNNARCPR